MEECPEPSSTDPASHVPPPPPDHSDGVGEDEVQARRRQKKQKKKKMIKEEDQGDSEAKLLLRQCVLDDDPRGLDAFQRFSKAHGQRNLARFLQSLQTYYR